MTDLSPPPPNDAIAALLNDPRFQAQRAREEAERMALETQRYADPTVLRADLEAFGAPATALETYFNRVPLSSRSMAILIAHLPRNYAPPVWESIVRSLSRPEGRPALPMLCWAYRIERVPARRWLLANAIGAMAKLGEVSDLPDIATYEALFRPGMVPPHRRPAP